jgi:predicted adenylyl cyclase CyaB
MRNIELKAHLPNPAEAETACKNIDARFQQNIRQTDTYFVVPNGRLKLRECTPGNNELIHYRRADVADTKESEYSIVLVESAIKEQLTQALGQLIVVNKVRALWLWENVRIHLDTVEDLGTFIEFEAVLSDEYDDADGHQKLNRLQNQFNIQPEHVIDGSYSDLMLSK